MSARTKGVSCNTTGAGTCGMVDTRKSSLLRLGRLVF